MLQCNSVVTLQDAGGRCWPTVQEPTSEPLRQPGKGIGLAKPDPFAGQQTTGNPQVFVCYSVAVERFDDS